MTATALPALPALTVESLGDGRYQITGGAEPHVVIVHANGPLCDCKDFQFGKRRGVGCKHVDAVTAAQSRAESIPPAAEMPGLGDGGPGIERDVPLPDPPSRPALRLEPAAREAPDVHVPTPAHVAAATDAAEQAVLSAALLARTVPTSVAAVLESRMFRRESHRLLYDAMVALTARGEPLDPVTLQAGMNGQLERAGGMEYIAALIDVVPTAAHIDHYAANVRRAFCRRELTAIGQRFGTEIDSGIRALLARAQAAADDLGGPAEQRFQLLSITELLALPAPTWLLERYLPLGGLSVLYGAPGSGKSFLAIDWALSIATGQSWIDSATQRGTVVYVAAEGSSGLGKRVQAYCDSHETTSLDGMHFVREPVNLREPRDVDGLLAAAAPTKPALVVIDTLSRCMEGGDENSPEDMGRIISSVDRIRRTTGGGVLLVHHAGWSNNDRPRGHSSLVGAADAVFSLKNDAGALTLEFSKPHKDAPPVEPLQLRLEARGDSCVVEPQDSLKAIGDLVKMERLALEALNETDTGDGVTNAEWKTAALEGRGGRSQMSRATFLRSLKRLSQAGLIKTVTVGRRSKRYSLTGKGISACAVS